MPGSIRDVTVTRGLLNGWDLIDPETQVFDDKDDIGHGGRFMAGIGDFTAADRFRQGDDETQEVFRSRGVVEFADIIRGSDFFGWDLEMERRSNGGDFLGLRDRS